MSMKTGIGIRLANASFTRAGLPTVVNYKTAIANHAACVGAWRFDDDSLITEDGSGVSSIASWRTGGPALTFASGTKAARTTDSTLGRKVLTFAAGGRYDMATTFNPLAKYTMLAIFKPDNYTTQGHVIGSYDTVTGNVAGIRKLVSAGSAPILRHIRGGNQAQSGIADAAAWIAAYASHKGTSDIKPSIQQVGGSIVQSTGTATESITGNLPFTVGHQSLSYVGKFDFVALFSDDLIYEQAALKALCDTYLTARKAA